jgi:hypothetical protein
MPQPLSPEDFDSQFGGGFAAQPPQAGLGTRFGAAIDRAQAGLLGVGEAAGLPLGDLRRQNQFEQEQSSARYFRDNPNEPQSYKDVDSVGSAMRYLRGLGIDASPELVTSLLTGGAGSLAGLGYAGRVGLAAASNYPAALGDILQNQREEAGTTALGSAAALAVPYAAADLVGLDAAIAGGRMARTGIKRLDEMQGLRGGLARTGANVALNAPVEGLSETFQEGINQLGRMTVNPSQTLFNPEANERYLESFIGGAALGGTASGVMGGWRRSEGYQAPDRETDLTAPRTEQAPLVSRPLESQFVTRDQTVGLQSFINQTTGVDRTKRKGYAEQFKAAYDEPSGQFVSDPETGVERPLTVGEVLQREQAPMDLTQEKPADAAAASAAVTATVRDPRSYELRDTFGVIPTPSSLQLYTDIQATGIPADSDILMDVWKYAGEKPMTPKRLEKAQQLLDAAIIKSRQEATSGAGISTVQQPAGGVGGGSAVVPGVVGATGSPVAAAGGNVQPAGAAGAPVQQAGILPVAPSQPAAPVTPAAPAAPETRFRRAPRPMTVLEAANAAKAAQAQQTETQGSQAPAPAGSIVDPRQAMMQRIFGQRNGDIIFDVVGMGMPEPEAATKYGLSRQAIQKIAGATGADQRAAQIARAKTEQGITDAQIAEAFAVPAEEELGTEVEREVFGRGQAPGAITEAEAIEGGLENIVKTAGAGTAEVEGFTKLQKDIDATLEALASVTDEAQLAELNAKLEDQIEKIKAVEKRAQAEVRRTAGKAAEPTVEGEEDAVQVESAAEVPVREGAKAGKGVGKQVRGAKKPAGESQVLTEAEQAGQAWDKVAADYPTAPKFADLTDEQRQDFIDFGPENWTKSDVETELTKLAKSGMKFGKEGAPAREPYTAKQLLAELKAFIRSDIPGRKLMIVDSVADLLSSGDKNIRAVGAALQLQGAYGVAVDGRAFLVANRIKQGSGRAKFMHEVGGHLGLDNLLTKADQDKLVNQIKAWAKGADGSLESELALQAFERVQAAQTPKEDQRSELIAYFIESAMEMGVDPTAATDAKLSGPLRNWFRTLWAAFKVAARKLGMKPESMTAQDVVNLAYGAARLEINGTWHGTAAAFRNFRNKFIGSGEGATAYGWGTYLAQRTGIAKGYWSADVSRKTTLAELNPNNVLADYQGWELAEDVVSPMDRSVLLRAGEVVDKSFASDVADVVREFGVDNINLVSPKGKQEVVFFAKPLAPEGSLMRVDTAIQDDHVFDYDKPVIKQSNYVVDKLLALLDPVADDIVDRTNKDVEELTGKDLIGSGENDLGLLSQLIMDDAISLPAGQDKQFDEAVRQGKFHEAASHLLRGIGLDGIKFYDAKSRGSATNAISFDGRRYNRDDLRDQVRKYRGSDSDKAMQFLVLGDVLRNGLAETKQALVEKVAEYEQRFFDTDKESAARYNVKFDEDKALADAKALAQRTVYQAKQLAWLNANEKEISLVQNQKMRNLIVFDDKNIFRVGAEAAADRQRMKFGKSAEQINRAVSKLPEQARKPVSNSVNTIADWARQGLDRVVFTGDLINRAVDAGLTAAKKFEGLLAKRSTKARELEREVERIADMYAVIAEKDKGTGPNSANQFIFDSTRTGKWGYGKYADPAMAARFNALAPKTQEFVKAVFAHGDKMLSAKKATVLKYATSEYDGRIAMEKDPVKKAALLKDKANDLKKFARLFQIREGIPYAPIKRFGAHVVIAKSKAYIDAKAANDTKLLSQLEKDPDHYHVSFTDTKNEARNLVSQLETQGHFNDGTVAFKERSTAEKELFGNSDSLGAITRLRAMADAKANAGEKDAAQMQRMISDLYLQALAEGSARKSEMRRRGVAGEVDMLRSFAAQGRADANFIASVEYNPQVQDAIQEMRSQENSGSGDLNRKSELLNELTKRYESSLDVTATPTLSKITRLSSIYYLATSPAYYLQNLTQPWMMSLPAMSGRHDYTKASGELFKAYGQLSGVMKSAKLFDQQFDFSKVPADVRAAIQELANRGKIDIGMETELGEFKVEGDSAFSKGWNKVDKGMRVAVQKVESINRLSTAMAAYRLELAKTGKVEDAINYADRILTETHGDYTAFNAPRFFNNPVGKIALQFRKFQLIQLTYYAKLINEAFTGTEKKAAIKALTYSLGHTALLAGAMGLPGYSAIAWLIGALLSDEDEPYDVTQELRKWIGDEATANLIMRGAPTLAGMDISGKVGAGNMLSIMPFSQADLTTRAGVIEAAGTLLGGAPVGMAARVADGLGLMLGGNWYKGMEQVLPKGLGDAAKAYRIATEGVTRRNGDIVLPASEVSATEAIMQAIGIQPVQQSVIMERQQATREMDQSFQDRSTRVKADYIKAVRAGESTTEARAAWTKLQEARVNNGYTRQPLSELLKAPQNQAKRERQTKEGVQFNKANKRFVEGQV